jgi:DNA-binding response OmpR family regulator
MNPKRILVVEDDPVSSRVICHKLASRGYEIITALDGAEAATKTRMYLPHLIVLDLGLSPQDPFSGPNWDGFNFMEWMNHNFAGQRIPVIVLSAWEPSTAAKKSLELGALAFFQKPAEDDEFFKCVSVALGEAAAQPSSEQSVKG